jgi:DNA-binding transcriptional MocR family regulator
MFLWARFAADIDTAEVAQQATDQGLLLAPGKLFVTGDQPNPWLRFNVAHSDHAQVYRFLERIAAGKA